MNRKNRRYPFFDDFDDWFNLDIQQVMNEMNEMMRYARRNTEQTKGKPLYYGYSVKVGPDGVPHVSEWGNVKPSGERIDTKACSCDTPAVDQNESKSPSGETIRDAEGEDGEGPYTCSMFDEKKNELKIHADIPGISKEDIELELRDDKLILNARTENRYYHKEIPIDHEIESKDINANYNNGVLEITLKCKKARKPKKAEKIDIE